MAENAVPYALQDVPRGSAPERKWPVGLDTSPEMLMTAEDAKRNKSHVSGSMTPATRSPTHKQQQPRSRTVGSSALSAATTPFISCDGKDSAPPAAHVQANAAKAAAVTPAPAPAPGSAALRADTPASATAAGPSAASPPGGAAPAFAAPPLGPACAAPQQPPQHPPLSQGLPPRPGAPPPAAQLQRPPPAAALPALSPGSAGSAGSAPGGEAPRFDDEDAAASLLALCSSSPRGRSREADLLAMAEGGAPRTPLEALVLKRRQEALAAAGLAPFPETKVQRVEAGLSAQLAPALGGGAEAENKGRRREEEGGGGAAAVAGLVEFWEETRQDEQIIRELAAVANPRAGFKMLSGHMAALPLKARNALQG